MDHKDNCNREGSYADRLPAWLVLENGQVFSGWSVGFPGSVFGEVVFNTSMTGYQEILTDPSYAGQMLAFTYPHIGNQGMNLEDNESEKMWLQGVIVHDLVQFPSNYRLTTSLANALRAQRVTGITGINTRHLTQVLRTAGTLKGGIFTAKNSQDTLEHDAAVEQVRAHPGLQGADLTAQVSTPSPYVWEESSVPWRIAFRDSLPVASKTVVVYDFGVKRSILRRLKDRGVTVQVVPARMKWSEARAAYCPDGVVLSNGPGDPDASDDIIANIRAMLQDNVPILGICLGHQMLALALGARTFKMKFGHHGANHPVRDMRTQRVYITSQNHGFAVDMASLPAELLPTYEALFDATLQGYASASRPLWGFQGHPEAGPGPHEMVTVIDTFVQAL